MPKPWDQMDEGEQKQAFEDYQKKRTSKKAQGKAEKEASKELKAKYAAEYAAMVKKHGGTVK